MLRGLNQMHNIKCHIDDELLEVTCIVSHKLQNGNISKTAQDNVM